MQEVDISKIEMGQDVKLYIHAFPHMSYKIFSGRVSELPSRNQVVPPNATTFDIIPCEDIDR